MAVNRKKVQKQLKAALARSGIEGAYSALIREAIINDWGEQQFVQALVRTKAFRRQYPGLVRGGHINDFLLGQEGAGVSFSTLSQALGNYRTLWQSYETAGRAFGYGKLTKNQVAALINGEKSPDEFAAAAQAVQQVQSSQETLNLYNQQRKAAGMKPLSQRELFQAFASRDQSWVDTYEATRLRMQQGFGFNAAEANTIAKSIGQPGQLVDPDGFGQLVGNLRARVADIGPELEREGISRVQLAQFLANPNDDRLGISQRIAQLESRRRGMGTFAQGQPARPGGGASPGAVAYG